MLSLVDKLALVAIVTTSIVIASPMDGYNQGYYGHDYYSNHQSSPERGGLGQETADAWLSTDPYHGRELPNVSRLSLYPKREGSRREQDPHEGTTNYLFGTDQNGNMSPHLAQSMYDPGNPNHAQYAIAEEQTSRKNKDHRKDIKGWLTPSSSSKRKSSKVLTKSTSLSKSQSNYNSEDHYKEEDFN